VQRIAIRASDDSGQPIEGARAEFRTLSSGKVLELESARFRDGEGLAPYVDFALRVTAEGFAAADLGQFRRLQVPPQLEVVLHRASQFHGVVLGAAGVPLEGARVELLEALPRKRAQVAIGSVASGEPFTVSCSKQSANSVVSTDASGRFALDAPAAGAYFARVSAADLAPQTIGPLQLEDSTSIDRTFTLSSGGALEGRVVRRDGGDVTGTVVGASCGDGYVATARAGPDGEFRFEHLAERNWQVRCVARETAEEWGALDFEHVAPTTSPPSWDALVREGKVAQCEVVIDDSGLLFRGALEINGSLQGAWVAELASVANPRRAPVSCVLDPDGRFEMRVLDAGDYRLRISRITRTEPGIEIAATVPVGQIGRWECLLGGTGTLKVHSDAQPNEGTRFVARASTRIGESISFTGEAPLDERGFATFANWPSGTTTVRLDNDSGLPNAPEIEVVLGIGETRTVELKPN
jgi:hypothetical protein